MTTQKVEFLSPVGRLVQGDCFEAQTTDMQGNPRVYKSGPKIGQPNPQFFIAVAFAKNDPAWPAFWALLDKVARQGFPNLFPNNGACVLPTFAWKVVDGDGFDTSGKPNNQKEGFTGCWVVRFSSGYAPRCFHTGRYAPHEQISDPLAIRRGYYVRVAGNVSANGDAAKPGLYLNLNLVELCGYGPEITSGPDASAVFGATPAPVLPAGASAIPLGAGAPAPGPGAAMPGAPAMPPMAPPAAPAPAAMPPVAPPVAAPAPAAAPVAVAPNPGFLTVPGGAPAPATPAPGTMPPAPPAPAAPTRVMTAAANGATYEAYVQAGWTDAQMIASGVMVMQ